MYISFVKAVYPNVVALMLELNRMTMAPDASEYIIAIVDPPESVPSQIQHSSEAPHVSFTDCQYTIPPAHISSRKKKWSFLDSFFPLSVACFTDMLHIPGGTYY